MPILKDFFPKPRIPLEGGGALTVCPGCKRAVPGMDESLGVCPECGFHTRLSAKKRIAQTADEGSFSELFAGVGPGDPLHFPGYPEKLSAALDKNPGAEAVLTGECCVCGIKTAIFAMDGGFMMGSMGTAVGERLALLFEHAAENRLPVLGYTASGGARMQEGMLSLMQMAKVSGAVKRHSDAGLFYLTVLTDPTTGGVTASFAMEGDIIISEPGALIAFAGPRVIEQTTHKKLPEGFQRAEFLLEHGFCDMIVPRAQMRDTVGRLLRIHCGQKKLPAGERPAFPPPPETQLDAYDLVALSRAKGRPTARSYIEGIFSDFTELHGDRLFGDDAAVICGTALLGGCPVTVIGTEKGADTAEKIRRSFGSPRPEGYRKALRLMKQAEKFHRPVVCFVDTSGAYCGIDAEERGQGSAIAANISEMLALKTPIISVMIGEGGSGGALALAAANEVWMLENAYYSVISPEGAASIMWKDAGRVREAAECLRLTARELLSLGICEAVVREDENTLKMLKSGLTAALGAYCALGGEQLAKMRYDRFRDIGRNI